MTAKFIWEFLYLNQIVWSTFESTCKIYNREKTNSALKQVDTTKSFRIATSNYCNAAYFLSDFSPRKRDVFFFKKERYHSISIDISTRVLLSFRYRLNHNSSHPALKCETK